MKAIVRNSSSDKSDCFGRYLFTMQLKSSVVDLVDLAVNVFRGDTILK